jgi:hypothetical protein
MPETPGENPRRSHTDLFSACCELPASQASAVQNIKLTVPFSVFVTMAAKRRSHAVFAARTG